VLPDSIDRARFGGHLLAPGQQIVLL
jgi:hypothetical protein